MGLGNDGNGFCTFASFRNYHMAKIFGAGMTQYVPHHEVIFNDCDIHG